jgi:hypothetical protein
MAKARKLFDTELLVLEYRALQKGTEWPVEPDPENVELDRMTVRIPCFNGSNQGFRSTKALWLTVLAAARHCRFLARSVTCFFLMPEGQHINRIGGWIMAVQRNIARASKANDQLAQLRQFGKRPSYVWRRFQKQELPLNGLARPPGRLRIVRC